MSIFIQKGGILSTIQDLGRTNYRQFGINPNGAMDSAAVRLINILLGNDETEAVLETHFPAPEIVFEKDAIIALGGADFSPQLDNNPIENWRSFFVQKGGVLKFKQRVSGNRAYLSIKGGFAIKNWLGSASTNLTAEIGGFGGRSLQAGDKIPFNSRFSIQDSGLKNQKPKTKNQKPKFPYKISNDLIPPYSSFPTIRVTAGAEFGRLTALGEQNFFKQIFTIRADSDRMGFRLKGAPLYLLEDAEPVSSAVNFGTIQLLPDGQIIILMADHQTSGGYPRIAHAAMWDLPVLAQLGANDKVCFELISLEEAENLLLEFERDLSFLKVGVRLGKL